jgi:hypothetical protein
MFFTARFARDAGFAENIFSFLLRGQKRKDLQWDGSQDDSRAQKHTFE